MISAVTLAYNDEATIAGTIKCLKPFVDRHIVVISEKPYFGEPSPPDRTEDICEDLDCEVVKGEWSLDHFQRNVGNDLCEGSDWVFTFDSDEMMESEEIEKLIKLANEKNPDVICVRPEVYWRTPDYVLRPIPDYAPPIMMKPEVRFTYIRNVDHPWVIEDVKMHHLSWCDPKDIYKKVTNYAHATDFNGKIWYNTHYKNWKKGQMAILPTDSFNVEKKPLPQSLGELL